MAKIYEEISKSIANSAGKTDANLANDANNLGGIPADDYATKKYVHDYHNTKEAAQKEYIDQQDQAVLQEAKEYTNAQIRNQDFSSFAKITDVQALDDKLTEELTTGLTTQKSYTDGQIQTVVNDVNSNFDDVNTAISTLNSNQNELFQSVSNGKATVAAAITDKGVVTASDESFDTMAGNIRNIQSGGGELDENFVNTSDATATASDILLGKTAYAQGNKIYGTLIAQTEEGAPTYGTDTSGATATEDDIVYGKTAYARGQLLTGTAIFGASNGGVEEIYGASKESYTINKTNYATVAPPDGAETVSSINTTRFSYDGNYCVRDVTANGTNYIESFAVNDDSLYYQASSNLAGNVTYKKYRYTYEELGLTDDDGNIATSVLDIALGASGFASETSKCILAILYSVIVGSTESRYYKLLTYHLNDNGVIGKEYDNETNIIDLKKSTNSYYSKIVGSPIEPLTFYIFYFYNTSTTIKTALGKIKINISSNNGTIEYTTSLYINTSVTASNIAANNLKVSLDGKYVIAHCMSTSNKMTNHDIIYDVDSSYGEPPSDGLAVGTGSLAYLEGTNQVIRVYNTKVYVYTITRSGNTLTTTLEKTISLTVNNLSNPAAYGEIYTTKDNSKLILSIGNNNGTSYSYVSSTHIYSYDLEEILTSADNSSIEALQQYTYSGTISKQPTCYKIDGNKNDTRIQIHQDKDSSSYNPFMYTLKTSLDTENILGIIYKGKYFSSTKEHILTAGQGDVRTGKTFIGWQGYPETGTMEVTE